MTLPLKFLSRLAQVTAGHGFSTPSSSTRRGSAARPRGHRSAPLRKVPKKTMAKHRKSGWIPFSFGITMGQLWDHHFNLGSLWETMWYLTGNSWEHPGCWWFLTIQIRADTVESWLAKRHGPGANLREMLGNHGLFTIQNVYSSWKFGLALFHTKVVATQFYNIDAGSQTFWQNRWSTTTFNTGWSFGFRRFWYVFQRGFKNMMLKMCVDYFPLFEW